MRWGVTLAVMLCACGAQPGEAPPQAALRSEVDRGSVTIGLEVVPEAPRLSDEVTFTLTVVAPAGVQVSWPAMDALEGFRMRETRDALPGIDGERRLHRRIHTLEPSGAGPRTLGPFSIELTNGDEGTRTVESAALTVPVTTMIEGEVTNLKALAPPADPVELSPEPAPIWPWALPIALAVVVLLLLRRRKPAQQPGATLTPTELAEQELRQLVRVGPRADLQGFYVELTAIVRRYIERTTGVRAPEQTTDEFLRAMDKSPGFDGDARTKLREFLESSDLVKFAALVPPSAEIVRGVDKAKRFVGLEESDVSLAEEAA